MNKLPKYDFFTSVSNQMSIQFLITCFVLQYVVCRSRRVVGFFIFFYFAYVCKGVCLSNVDSTLHSDSFHTHVPQRTWKSSFF